jgi:hypothetical protein
MYNKSMIPMYDGNTYGLVKNSFLTNPLIQALQPLKLSSILEDIVFEQMRTMKLTSGASFISFQVLAVGRYPGTVFLATHLPVLADLIS